MRGNMWSLLGWLGVPIGILVIMYKCFLRRTCIDVAGKVVLITGANSGVGQACTHAFYKAGCRVILAGRRQNELNRVKEDLRKLTKPMEGCDAQILVMDLSQLADLPSKANDAISMFGRVDILINNAGISYRGDILTTELSVHQKVMQVNYFGQVQLTCALLPHMMRNGWGCIVAISSIQGKMAIPYRSAYAASKHALQAFCDCLRAEVADKNIDVCVISPGYIRTNLSINAVHGDGSPHGEMDDTISKGMSPDVVAETVLSGVINRQKDILLDKLLHRTAVYMCALMPNLLFWVMARRAKTECHKTEKNE